MYNRFTPYILLNPKIYNILILKKKQKILSTPTEKFIVIIFKGA